MRLHSIDIRIIHHRLTLVGILVFALVGCGTTFDSLRTSFQKEQPLSDLRVLDLSDKTEVVIQAEKPFTYNFLTLDHPPRVMINFPFTSKGNLAAQMRVNKGYIIDMFIREGRNPHRSVRLEILLAKMVKPEIKLYGNRLTIDFPKPEIDESNTIVDEYYIGPDDVLEVMVWKSPELTRTVTVRPDGKVSLPLIGDVQAAGLRTSDLKKNITKSLRKYLEIPEVSVVVTEVNSYFFYITGEIAKPGKYTIKGRTTLLQAISLAGGFTPFAHRNKIALFRKDPSGLSEKKYNVRYDDIISGENAEGNLLLRSGDTIVIP